VNVWQSFLSELPIVILYLIIWSREIFIGLSEVKSWDEEEENSENEWNEKSEGLLTNVDSEVLVLSLEERGTES